MSIPLYSTLKNTHTSTYNIFRVLIFVSDAYRSAPAQMPLSFDVSFYFYSTLKSLISNDIDSIIHQPTLVSNCSLVRYALYGNRGNRSHVLFIVSAVYVPEIVYDSSIIFLHLHMYCIIYTYVSSFYVHTYVAGHFQALPGVQKEAYGFLN